MPLGDGAAVVGHVVRTHGVAGELLVLTADEDPGDLLRAPRVLLDAEPGVIPYRVLEARTLGPQMPGMRVRLRLAGLDSPERAAVWVGAQIRVEPQFLAPRDPDEVYARELIGLRCRTSNGVTLGEVREIWPTPAGDQILVVGESGSRFLPARDDVLLRIDRESGEIEVDLAPIGLDEDET